MARTNLPGGTGGGGSTEEEEEAEAESSATAEEENVARGRRRARRRLPGFDEGEGLGTDDGDAVGQEEGRGVGADDVDMIPRDMEDERSRGDGNGEDLDYNDRVPSEEEMEDGSGAGRGTSEQRSGDLSEETQAGRESIVVDASTESQARAQATQGTGLRASKLDIQQTEAGFEVSFPDAQSRAARELNERVSGVDVSADDVEPTGEGGFTLSDDTQETVAQQRAASKLDDKLTIDVGADDVQVADGQVVLSSEAQERASEAMQDFRGDVAAATGQIDDSRAGLSARDFFPDEFEAVEEKVEEENPALEAGEDFDVTLSESGEFDVDTSESYEEDVLESVTRQIEAGQADQQRGNLGGDAADRLSPEEALTREINTETGAGLTAGDVEAVETGDDPNQYEAQLTESGREKLETELETESFTAKVPDSVPFVGGASSTLKGQARDVTVESEDGALNVETQERFGDIDFSFGLGGPEDEVEQGAAAVGEAIAEANREAAEDVFAEDGFLGDSLVAEGLDAAGKEDLSDQYEANVRSLLEDAYSAPGGVADLAANLPFESVEFAAEAGTSPIETGKKVPPALAGKGAAAGNFAAENPARFVGGLLGSAAVTGGLFRATAGTRLGTATRYALQPGEELAKSAARSGAISKGAATKVPGVRTQQFDADSGSAASRASDAAAEARQAIQQSTPDVSLVNDPDAGLVDVTPAARSQLRNAFSFDPPSVRSGLSRRIQATRDRAATQFEAAQLAGSSTLDTARNFDVDAAAGDVANAVDAASDTIAGTAKGAAFSAEASAFNARRALRDADLDDLLPSRDSDALLGPAQGRLRGLGVDANLAARRAANADLEDLTPDLPSFTDSDADVGRVRGSLLGASASAEAAAHRAASADASDALPDAPDLSAARDLTLRVEPTRPPRTPLTRTVDANEVELTDSEAEVFDDVDTLTDLDDVDVNAAAGSGDTGGRINNAPDVEVGAGGTQRALMRTRSERSQRRQPVAELETEVETETTLGPGMAAEIDPEPFDVEADLTATGTESLTGDDTLGAVATSETVATDLDDTLGVEATGFETTTEVGVGFESGAGTDTETEAFPFEAAATDEVTAEAEREREAGLETPAFELESNFGAQDSLPVFDDDGGKDDTASDLFENPTISPEEAVGYDPFGGSKKKSESAADDVGSDLDDLF